MKRLGLVAVLCLCALSLGAARRKDGYILRLDDRTQIARLDMQTFEAVHESIRGPVLWVQRDGRRYEIRDPSILGRAAEAVRPVTRVNDEHEAFRERTRSVYDEEEELDREIDACEDVDRPDEARLAELRARRRALAPRLRAVEDEERSIEAREERAEAVSERTLDALIDEAIRKGLARRLD
jgi:hypothetical protein